MLVDIIKCQPYTKLITVVRLKYCMPFTVRKCQAISIGCWFVHKIYKQVSLIGKAGIIYRRVCY